MIASFLAFVFALGSGARLLKSTSLWKKRFDFSTPPLFASKD
jgi:hypothetical protein